MSRSLKKGPFIDDKLLKKIQAMNKVELKVIKTWSRDPDSPVLLDILCCHNGIKFVFIYENMVVIN